MDEVDCLNSQQISKFHYLPQNLSFQRRGMTKHKTIYENCLTNCHSNNEITQDIWLFLRNQFNTCFCIYSQSIRNASNTFHIQYYPCKYKIINNLKVEEIIDQYKHWHEHTIVGWKGDTTCHQSYQWSLCKYNYL